MKTSPRVFVSASALTAAGVVAAAMAGYTAVESDAVFNPRIWSMFAGGPSRVSIAAQGAKGPFSIQTPRWVKDGDSLEQFSFYGQAGVVLTEELAIAVGFQSGAGEGQPRAATDTHGGPTNAPDVIHGEFPAGVDSVVAFSREDGAVVWSAIVPIALLDSWSAPAVDTLNDALVICAGGTVLALSLDDGSTLWTTNLGRIVVNASPAVTADRTQTSRVFITDHSFATAGTGKLFCINASPYDPVVNPYDPGEIVWEVSLPGQTSGNTPAYADGVVYVSTATGGTTWDQGMVMAFPADAVSAPQALWTYEHTDPTGFFSGVVVRSDAIYASTYSFHGGQFSAATVRLDADTGRQRWSVPTNRTDVVPVPLPDGRVLVSGGVPFTSMFPAFGSLPSLQLIVQHAEGNGAALAWDSAMDTLDDTNANGQWDPGEDFLAVGGWTNQPVVLLPAEGGALAYAGASPDPVADGFFGPSPAMYLINLDRHPSDPGFVIGVTPDCGGSPALSETELYAVGFEGLYAFGSPSWPSGLVLARWANSTLPDFNGDGFLDGSDLLLALRHARD